MKKNLKVKKNLKKKMKRKTLFRWVTKDPNNLMAIVFLRNRSLTMQQVNQQYNLTNHCIQYFLGGKATATLFVGNLSYDADTDALTEFFTSQGLDPSSVRILEDSEGSSRG